MTSLPSARRRAEEFADAVDSVLGGGRPAKPVAAGSTLIDLVLALAAVPAPAPRPEFTADLRQRLLIEAAMLLNAPETSATVGAGAGRAPTPTRRPRRQGRIVAAASAFAVVGGSAGVATAAQHALPGEALYPIKRALEGAELRLSTSDAGRGRDLLEQASSRLDELSELLPVTAGSDGATAAVAARVPATVSSFTSQAVEGSAFLLDAFEEDNDPQTVVEVRSFAAGSVGTLSDLAAAAPSDVRDQLVEAAGALQSIDRQAVELCADCGEGGPPLQIPADFGEPAEDDVVDGAGGDREDGGATSADDESPDDGGSPETSDQDGREEDGSSDGDQPGPSSGPATQDGTAPDPTGDWDYPTDVDGATDPTDVPTESPTDVPTDVPTESPTDAPTESPTESPTDAPTEPDGEPTDGSSSGDPEDDPEDDEPEDGEDDDPEDDLEPTVLDEALPVD